MTDRNHACARRYHILIRWDQERFHCSLMDHHSDVSNLSRHLEYLIAILRLSIHLQLMPLENSIVWTLASDEFLAEGKYSSVEVSACQNTEKRFATRWERMLLVSAPPLERNDWFIPRELLKERKITLTMSTTTIDEWLKLHDLYSENKTRKINAQRDNMRCPRHSAVFTSCKILDTCVYVAV